MTQDNPLLLVGVTIGFVALFFLWLADLRHALQGQPKRGAFPGAVPVPSGAVLVGIVGTVILLAIEIVGEYAFGIVGEQTRMSWLFSLYSVAAGFGEELVFRGYLVITGRGRNALIASAAIFSAVFALSHAHLWSWEGGLVLHGSVKAWFSTTMIFAGSLWFYFLRFQRRNPAWSLIPCIIAHTAKNLLVIGVKAAQGFVGPG